MTKRSNRRTVACPKCAAQVAEGVFCSECGARLDGKNSLVTGPRLVALAAVGALVVVVALQARSRTEFSAGGTITAPAPTLAGGALPDIESMSPRVRAGRLYDRIMRLNEEKKTDSIAIFAPMALASYAAIEPMDLDARYDMARIAMVSGDVATARAQADTILAKDATHLLGLLLAADAARARNDLTEAKRLEKLFVSSADRERARNLEEYTAHGNEIANAITRLSK